MATKNFIYGIAVVKFNQKEIGYIEKGSWDWGGTKAESTDIEAEQVPDAPVLTLANKNATIAPTFNLIQLDYENIQAVLGGTLVGTTGSYTGWKAPTDLVELRGPWEIKFVSGQTMKIPNGTIMANLGGKLTLTDFYDQLQKMKNMGSMEEMLGMLPGVDAKALAGAKIDEKQMAHTEAIIQSMTPKERDNPSIINFSRKKRIAAGCGLSVEQVNKLLKQFEMMQKMMKQFKKSPKGFARRLGGMMGNPNAFRGLK